MVIILVSLLIFKFVLSCGFWWWVIMESRICVFVIFEVIFWVNFFILVIEVIGDGIGSLIVNMKFKYFIVSCESCIVFVFNFFDLDKFILFILNDFIG